MPIRQILFLLSAVLLFSFTAEARKKIDPEAQRTAKELKNRFTCLRALSATARELGMPYSQQTIQVAERVNSSCYFCGNGSEDYTTSHPMLWRRANGKDVYVTITDVNGANLKKKAPVVSLLEYERVDSGAVCIVNKKKKQMSRTFNIRPDGEVAFDDDNFMPKRCSAKKPVKGYTYVQPRELEEEETANRQASLFSELDAEIERMINYASYDRVKSTVERRSKWREQVRNPKIRTPDTPFFMGSYAFAPEECDQVVRPAMKDRLDQAREDVLNLSKWSREIERTEDGFKDAQNDAVLNGKKRASVKRKANPPAPAPATLDGSTPVNFSSGEGSGAQ